MIIIMKPGVTGEAVKKITDVIEANGLTVHLSQGEKVTIIGAAFLGFIAVLPILVSIFSTSLRGIALGGTTVLIVVGVALDTVRSLEAQLVMRYHKGFLD